MKLQVRARTSASLQGQRRSFCGFQISSCTYQPTLWRRIINGTSAWNSSGLVQQQISWTVLQTMFSVYWGRLDGKEPAAIDATQGPVCSWAWRPFWQDSSLYGLLWIPKGGTVANQRKRSHEATSLKGGDLRDQKCSRLGEDHLRPLAHTCILSATPPFWNFAEERRMQDCYCLDRYHRSLLTREGGTVLEALP